MDCIVSCSSRNLVLDRLPRSLESRHLPVLLGEHLLESGLGPFGDSVSLFHVIFPFFHVDSGAWGYED